jgi:hypothetical protein
MYDRSSTLLPRGESYHSGGFAYKGGEGKGQRKTEEFETLFALSVQLGQDILVPCKLRNYVKAWAYILWSIADPNRTDGEGNLKWAWS